MFQTPSFLGVRLFSLLTNETNFIRKKRVCLSLSKKRDGGLVEVELDLLDLFEK